MPYKYLPVLVFLLIGLTSCENNKKKTITDSKFYQLEQQGWKSKRITHFKKDINYTATEVPLQYYIYKQVGDNSVLIDSIYKINNKERIVEVEFQHSNEADLLKEEFTKKTYENAVKYIAFNIQEDFSVVTSSNDTINCIGVHFERNFKVAPFKRVLLYFNNINPNDNIKLIYQDKLFGNGIFNFNFKETPIKL